MTQRLTQLDNVPAVMSPAEFTKFVRAESATNAKIVREGKYQVGFDRLSFPQRRESDRHDAMYGDEVRSGPPPSRDDTLAERSPVYRVSQQTTRKFHVKADDLRGQLIRTPPDASWSTFKREPHYESEGVRLARHRCQKLGMSVDIVPPGKRACPYHFHYAEEEAFIVLEATVRCAWPVKCCPSRRAT